MVFMDAERYTQNALKNTRREFDYHNALETGDWGHWQSTFRSRLENVLGLNKLRDFTSGLPFDEHIEEVADFDTYTSEKTFLLAEPGVEIPFYLLLPKTRTKPLPLVIAVHGHHKHGKEIYAGRYHSDEEKAHILGLDENVAVQAVHQGYTVIAPDVRGFNEMGTEEDFRTQSEQGWPIGSCETLQRKALMLGRTLIGERVHDIGRLIDYAQTRREIDTSQIVITGNSGGGTVSLFTAICDDRISIAIPGSYFNTFEASILPIRHCYCNIIPGILTLGEMYDIAGLFAPRPILFVHGSKDNIYPIEGTQVAFQHLSNIYQAMGYPDHCELFVGDKGHQYYKERVWSFVAKHLAQTLAIRNKTTTSGSTISLRDR